MTLLCEWHNLPGSGNMLSIVIFLHYFLSLFFCCGKKNINKVKKIFKNAKVDNIVLKMSCKMNLY